MKSTIITNPKIRFGKPTIQGTRITVEEVMGALAGGMDVADIREEYGLTKQQITAAIGYVAAWLKGEVVKDYEISTRR